MTFYSIWRDLPVKIVRSGRNAAMQLTQGNGRDVADVWLTDKPIPLYRRMARNDSNCVTQQPDQPRSEELCATNF